MNYSKETAKNKARQEAQRLGISVQEFVEEYLGIPQSTWYDWKITAIKAFVSYFQNKEYNDDREEETIEVLPDEEIIKENVRLAKSKQRFMDSNRIERKSFREYARMENALTEYNEKLVSILSKHDLSKFTKTYPRDDQEMTAIVQISDVHFNELVNMKNNVYNFEIASKRFKKFADEIKAQVGDRCSDIIVAFTGDMVNSDRRLDELLNQATNRANATIIAIDILKSFLLDLNRDYNIQVISVSGNESRLDEELGFSDFLATNNYDSAIFNMLAILFQETDGIEFRFGNPVEQVIEVQGKNILVTHGLAFGKGNTELEVQKTVGRYAGFDILLDYCIFGHLHSCHISDTFARSGSMVGANAYSERKLNVAGRASQNIHFVTKKGIDSLKVDLQDVENIEGYECLTFSDSYNPKSEQKTKEEHCVFKIII